MSKVNELLAKLDAAFDAAEVKASELAAVRAQANKAIEAKKEELRQVEASYDAKIAKAQKAADDARMALESAREQVNERVGNLTGLGTDPRVTVR